MSLFLLYNTILFLEEKYILYIYIFVLENKTKKILFSIFVFFPQYQYGLKY